MKTETGQAIRLVDYRPFPFEIPHIDLTFDLDAEATIVKSRLDVVPRDGEAPGTPLVLDGVELTLRSIAINGTPLQEGDYLYKDDKLIVHSPPAQPFVLETEVAIHPGQNKTLMGLYVSNDFLCTQCEAEGFRRITFFADRPDVLSVYTVTLIASQKAAPILLANGNATDRGTKEEGKHWVRWTDPFPKPAYLFALVAGDLAHIDDQFTTQSGRQVTLQIFVEHGKEDRCAYAMDALKRSMAWDEEAFGLEYDLDIFMIVAVSAFNFGAMENKGLNIFNDKLILASPETATDADYEGIESVIAHEYFHNWTGNRITCRDWFQLCLKEGLTVYRDQRFTEDMREPTVARIDSVQQLRARQFREDGGPLAHPVRPSSFVKIDNFYTSTVYEKGAELCRMLATLAGIEGFRAGIALYFERHDGTAATVEAFLDAIFDANGGTLGGIDAGRFLDWYTQAGTPTVSVATLPASEGNDLHLKLAQDTAPSPGEPNKKPLPIPLRLALIDPDGAPVPLELQADQAMVDGPSNGGGDVVIVLNTAEQTINLGPVPAAARLSVNRGFSAPIKVRQALSIDDRLALFQSDTDLFNRWEVGQSLVRDFMLGAIGKKGGAGDKGLPPSALPPFVDLLASHLTSEAIDPALMARMMSLPAAPELAQAVDTVDPAAIVKARDWVAGHIAKELRDLLIARLDRLPTDGAFSPSADQAGRRALRRTLLTLLSATDTEAVIERAESLYERMQNMTDRITSLSAVNHLDDARREGLFARFYETWSHDPLVMDKWMGLQATSRRPGTFDRVKTLMRDRVFDLENPNRVRALLGMFAMHNLAAFHDASGAPYSFFMDRIVDIDRLNPMLSSRLLPAVSEWSRLEPARRALLKQALETLAHTENLSANLLEVLEKTRRTETIDA